VRRGIGLALLLILATASYRLWFPSVNAVTIVAGAPDALIEKETAHFKTETVMTTVRSTAGGAEMTLRFRGEGAYDYKNQLGRVTISGLPTQPGFPVLGRESVYAGSAVFMRIENCQAGALGGKNWIKIDAAQLTGVDPSTQPTSQDPTSTLEVLRGAGEVTEIGREKIDGVETTRYRVKIDIDKALTQLTPERREQLRSVFEQLKSSGASTEVWIDDTQLPRRFKSIFNIEGTAPGVSSFKMTNSMDFLDYGKPVSIDVPSDDEVHVADGTSGLTSAVSSCFPSNLPQIPQSGSPFPGPVSPTPL
jgi:hypothetical protein